MKKVQKRSLLFMLGATACLLLIFLIMQPLNLLHFGEAIAIIFPKGIIALKERNLLFILQLLMLLVIVPVYILTFIFSWRYRADNPIATYDPDLIDNSIAEYIWWGVPLVMTLVVCSLTWVRTAQLDPFKPIPSDKKELTIQAIALQWKWLFIYPEEKIASVNFLQFPKERPIHFEITADAPMNSFWIPDLGGQIYAMPKMKTELYLIANEEGDFRGSSANFSGEGFASMHFIARASSQEEYLRWLESAKTSSTVLDLAAYQQLAIASKEYPPQLYLLKEESLFNQVIDKYMFPPKVD